MSVLNWYDCCSEMLFLWQQCYESFKLKLCIVRNQVKVQNDSFFFFSLTPCVLFYEYQGTGWIETELKSVENW